MPAPLTATVDPPASSDWMAERIVPLSEPGVEGLPLLGGHEAEGEPLARVCLGAGDDSGLGGKRVCSRRCDRSIRSKVAVRLHDRSRQRSIMLVEEDKKSLLRPLYFHACPAKSTGVVEG